MHREALQKACCHFVAEGEVIAGDNLVVNVRHFQHSATSTQRFAGLLPRSRATPDSAPASGSNELGRRMYIFGASAISPTREHFIPAKDAQARPQRLRSGHT